MGFTNMLKHIKKKVERFFGLKITVQQDTAGNILYNANRTSFQKTALLSYLIKAARKPERCDHTIYLETSVLLRVLEELEYNVDIVDFDETAFRKVKSDNYDLVIGFGNVFEFLYRNSSRDFISIYYATGMHVDVQNRNTLTRLKDVYRKTGRYFVDSIRYVDKAWSFQTTLVDGIVALGGEECANTYSQRFNGSVYPLPTPYINTIDPNQVLSERIKKGRRGFLWFGSLGLIHKGLDLLLECFSERTDCELFICGKITQERDFCDYYFEQLYNHENIHVLGFVEISSSKFFDVLKECDFVILASCSEGGAASVITAIGNGALIPVVTREAAVNTGFQIWIEGFDKLDINRAIDKALNMDRESISTDQTNNLNYIIKNNSKENYYIKLKEAIKNIEEKRSMRNA